MATPNPATTDKRIAKKIKKDYDNAGGAIDEYIPIDPTLFCSVQVIKDGETVTFDFTNGAFETNLDDEEYINLSTGTSDYSGEDKGITGFHISGGTPTNTVHLRIIQYAVPA